MSHRLHPFRRGQHVRTTRRVYYDDAREFVAAGANARVKDMRVVDGISMLKVAVEIGVGKAVDVWIGTTSVEART